MVRQMDQTEQILSLQHLQRLAVAVAVAGQEEGLLVVLAEVLEIELQAD
jgi:hypothetical protein